MADTASLIERLEKATGPDRSIDGLIKAAINPPSSLDDEPARIFIRYDRFDGHGIFKTSRSTQLSFKARVPHFTSSIDAAMTLVPEAEFYGLLIGFNPDKMKWEVFVTEWCYGETIPLALCIAALKSRSQP